MPLLSGFVGLTLLLSATPAIAPPAQPGAWHQAGAVVTSPHPGNAVHFFRIVMNPKKLGIVAHSSSSQPIKVFWFAYCEFSSDDDINEQHQGTTRGVGSVTVYPPVFDGATSCTVSVNVTPAKNAKLAAAVFAS